MTLKKIKILTLAKLQAIIFGLIGLVAGTLYSFGGLIIDTLVSIGWLSGVTFETPGLSYGTVLAFGALVGMPAIFATFGLASGIIGAILFKLLPKWIGGIKVDLEE